MRDKIIIALDVEPLRAREIVDQTKDLVSTYKIGPVLWMRWGAQALTYFHERGLRLMLDFKFHDIPNTVVESLRALAGLPGSQAIWGLTLHAFGGYSMLKSAVLEKERLDRAAHIRLFGVTVLTSLRERDLYRVGINRPVEAQVKKLAQLARDAGADGVVASAHEAAGIGKTCGPEFPVLVPGIRLEGGGKASLDQKRVATPLEALEAGAHYLIMGRDIYQAPEPRERVRALLEAITGFSRELRLPPRKRAASGEPR